MVMIFTKFLVLIMLRSLKMYTQSLRNGCIIFSSSKNTKFIKQINKSEKKLPAQHKVTVYLVVSNYQLHKH